MRDKEPFFCGILRPSMPTRESIIDENRKLQKQLAEAKQALDDSVPLEKFAEAQAEIERLKANFSDKAKAVLSLNVKLRKHREFVATPARRGS